MLNHKKVLVVDDDEIMLRAVSRQSSPLLDLHIATTANSAREVVLKHNPSLAVVDLCIGTLSGIDLISELKSINGEISVILVSAYTSIDVAVRAIRAGASDVIEKPVTLGEILERIGRKGQYQHCQTFEPEPATLARAQWEYVQRVLGDCNGNVSMAARKLGVYRTTLRRWLRMPAPPGSPGSTNYR